MGISSVGSGLPKDIVGQMMAAEQVPVKQMESRKADLQEKRKLMNELISNVNSLKQILDRNMSMQSLRELQVTSDTDSLAISADKNIAQVGSYQIEVVQLAQKSSAMSSGVKDPEKTSIGIGYVEYSLPDGRTRELYIDKENSNLKALAKLINEDKEAEITANIISDGKNTDDSWRIIFSRDANLQQLPLNFPLFHFVQGETNLSLKQEIPAQNAKMKLNGFEIDLPTNTTKDVIPGLTIDLKKAKPGENFTISVDENIPAMEAKITSFVEATNRILMFIKAQNNMNENTNTSRTLGGDVTLHSLESRIRATIMAPVEVSDGTSARLSDLGVIFSKDGLLEFDSNKFTSMIKSDFKKSSEILTGFVDPVTNKKNEGIIQKLRKITNEATMPPSGLLMNGRRGIDDKIAGIDKRIYDKLRSLEQKERILKDRFSRIEANMGKLRAQSSGVTSMMG